MILDNGPTPLYYQLRSLLETKIRSRELQEGERLPSEAELCQQFNVSRITVRQALSALFNDGLIYRERGKGTFVAEGARWRRPVLKGSIEDLLVAGVGTRIIVLSYEEIHIPQGLSKVLKTGKPERVHRLEFVRLLSEGPQVYSLVYFPPSLGKIISPDEIEETTEIISFVEDRLGIKAHGAHQTIDVGAADQVIAKNLSVKPRTPLLIIYREYFTGEGSLLFAAKSYYRPDRFTYEVELTRT
jgi:GntR family transcriptional regulator